MRVFISYNSFDRRVVAELGDKLNALRPDFHIYLAEKTNIGGSYWLPRISEELVQTDAVLLMLGETLGAWQELEYFEALRLNRSNGRPRIVPVFIGGDVPGLPFLDQFHALKLTEADPALICAGLLGKDEASLDHDVPAWRWTNPYRGLRAYSSQDAANFFGRDLLIDQVIEALEHGRPEFLALVGNSGVGKSSLVLAGVFSALRSQIWASEAKRDWPRPLADSKRWQTVVFRPDVRPLKSVALALTSLWIDSPAKADAEANAWVTNFWNGSLLSDLIALTARKLAALADSAGPSRFLIYVDQFEELYARSDHAEAKLFTKVFADAIGHPDIIMLATLRSDFYGDFQADKTLFPVSRRLDIPPFNRDAFEAVITEPARRLGAKIESPEIVALVADAAEEEPGALPLLSFLLTNAWDDMLASGDGTLRLTRDAVELSKPLIEHAEAFVVGYPEHQDALRQLISRRLVFVPKDGEIVRRRVQKVDLSEAEWEVAVALAGPDWRLMSLGEEGGIPTVDVAHETLLRAWPRARRWIDAEREFLIWRTTLEAARQTWEAAPKKQQDEAVLMGLALATAQNWLTLRGDVLSGPDCDFIKRSQTLADARIAKEKQREKTLFDERDRSRRRALWISRITSIAALVLLAVGGWATFERQRAEQAAITARDAQDAAEVSAADATRERRIAESSVAKYFATEATALNPASEGARALLLGVEAMRLDQTTKTAAALRSALNSFRWRALAGHEGAVYDVALSGDGAHMASVGADGTVRLWNLEDPSLPHSVLYRGSSAATSVELAGSHIAAGTDRNVYVWSLENLDRPKLQFDVPGSKFTVMALSRDGTKLFAAGAESGEVRDLTAPNRAPLNISHPVKIRAAAFGPEGQRLAVAGNSEVALWDLTKSGDQPTQLTADQSEVYAIAISADGSKLATVGFEPLGFRYASVWNYENLDAGSTIIRAKIGPMDWMYVASSLLLARDGSQLLVGSDDGTIRRWLPEEPQQNSVIFRAQKEINGIAVAPDRWVAAADANGLIHLYDQTGGGSEPRYFNFADFSDSPTLAVDVSADGRSMVTAISGGKVLRHAISHPEHASQLIYDAESDIREISHDPNGRWLAFGESEGRVSIIDLGDKHAPPKLYDLADGLVLALEFESTGERLIAGDSRGILVIDPKTGSASRLDTGGERPIGLSFLDDGGVLALTEGGRIFNWPSGKVEPLLMGELGGPVLNAAFSPDGTQIALTRSGSLVEIYDVMRLNQAPIRLDTGSRESTFSAFGFPVAFSPDGDWFGMVGDDSTVRIWETADWTRRSINMTVPGIMEVDIAFTKDGGHLITAGGWSSPPKLWATPTTLVQRACRRVGRNMSEGEWRSYWGEKGYARTCPDWPLPDDLIRNAAAQFFEHRDARRSLNELGNIWSERIRANQMQPPSLEMDHRTRMANVLVKSAMANFDPSSSNQPNVPKALRYLDAAGEMQPGFNPREAEFSGQTWNRVCWNSTVWGYADDVMWACELAVERAVGETKAQSSDSRGVARAATGDLVGASKDFTSFVAFFTDSQKYPQLVKKRREWLRKLETGENPITEEVLEALRNE